MSVARLFVSSSAVCGTIFVASVGLGGCAGAVVRPVLSPSGQSGEALLVLPGFGYSRAAERALRALGPLLADQGMDLYVPSYVTRSGLAESRATLQRFIRENRLDRYRRLHIFAFIAGGWTLNPLVERHALPNLATVIYDRSPFQERAPRIAVDKLRLFAWLRYGSTVFDVARTPYPPLTVDHARVALMIESTPTSFIRRHARAALEYGPLHFECEAFLQRYDDCLYLALDHDQLYLRVAQVWPELLHFIRTGRFTADAVRTAPVGDPLARPGPQ
jgi:hypothetical protein